MTRYVKPFLTIDEQIDRLLSRGMTLERDVAEQWLRNVGYYRMSGYWYPYRALASSGEPKRLDRFTEETAFGHVVELYEFDRKLRTLIHDGIERVEVAVRAQLSYLLGEKGSLSYKDHKNFRESFSLTQWLETAEQRVRRVRKHSEAIQHHDRVYGGKLPIWVISDVLDFADVSKLYAGLKSDDQQQIAERLGIAVKVSDLAKKHRKKFSRMHPFARWLEQLTVLRNVCAHHSRVWNRHFTPSSTVALRTIDDLRALPCSQSDKLYGALTMISFLLQRVSPGASWSSKVSELIEESFMVIPKRSISEMGFPESWSSEKLWSRGAPLDRKL